MWGVYAQAGHSPLSFAVEAWADDVVAKLLHARADVNWRDPKVKHIRGHAHTHVHTHVHMHVCFKEYDSVCANKVDTL